MRPSVKVLLLADPLVVPTRGVELRQDVFPTSVSFSETGHRRQGFSSIRQQLRVSNVFPLLAVARHHIRNSEHKRIADPGIPGKLHLFATGRSAGATRRRTRDAFARSGIISRLLTPAYERKAEPSDAGTAGCFTMVEETRILEPPRRILFSHNENCGLNRFCLSFLYACLVLGNAI